jgi:hypothetical protein
MTKISDVLSPMVIASALPVSWMIWWIVSVVKKERAREKRYRVPIIFLPGTNTFLRSLFQLNRVYVYSFVGPDTMINSSMHLFLPPDATDEWTAPLEGGFAAMYAPDREFMSRIVHVQLSAVLALCSLFNIVQGPLVMSMSPEERKSSTLARTHRLAGQTLGITLVPWTIFMFYTLFLHGMIPFGPVVEYGDKLGFLLCVTAFPLGIWYASVGKFKAHRACMIWGTAALWYIPLQRLLWRLAVVYAGSIETFGHLGNYFLTLDRTVMLSHITVLAIAFYYTKGTVKDWGLSENKIEAA